MQDRVPLYPGRVRLIPVSGQENIYDMVRSDEPTQEGDPLSKATFLKDATAALYGLGADAVPDDVLAVLSRFQSGLGNEYVWSKNTAQLTYTTEEKTLQVITNNTNGIYYSDSFTVNSDGLFELVNPTLLPAFTYTKATPLKGKYYIDGNKVTTGSVMYKCADNAIFEAFDVYVRVSALTKYTNPGIKYTVVDYVNSHDPSAYPPAVSDGYTYNALGQLGAKASIATGSYTGTGTYGSSNPNSLTFDFEPKIVFIGGKGTSGVYASFPYVWGGKYIYLQSNGTTYYNNVSIIGNTMTWYSSDGSGSYQLNTTGTVYNYIAIG